jgi:hypothetical protein
MDASNVLSLLEQLDDEIDDLEGSLAPLLNTTLAETSSKLPVLDKAKLYVLVTYAIESVLFCKSYDQIIDASSDHICSISTAQWRESSRSPRLHRTHQGQAVLREDQSRRETSWGEEFNSRQGCCFKNHQSWTGKRSRVFSRCICSLQELSAMTENLR